jgi:hypothetical protein
MPSLTLPLLPSPHHQLPPLHHHTHMLVAAHTGCLVVRGHGHATHVLMQTWCQSHPNIFIDSQSLASQATITPDNNIAGTLSRGQSTLHPLPIHMPPALTSAPFPATLWVASILGNKVVRTAPLGIHGDALDLNDGANELRGAAEMGGPPEGDEAEDVVPTLPMLCILWDAHIDVLLLCGVTMGCKNANGGKPMDEMLPLHGRQ